MECQGLATIREPVALGKPGFDFSCETIEVEQGFVEYPLRCPRYSTGGIWIEVFSPGIRLVCIDGEGYLFDIFRLGSAGLGSTTAGHDQRREQHEHREEGVTVTPDCW